jgi:TolA-binding protein
MRSLRVLLVAGAMAAVSTPLVVGQDKTTTKQSTTTTTTTKVRGQLPQNWGKLGLSDEQKQKVYSAQAKYRDKIDSLKKQIAELQDKEKKEMEDVLTSAQKTRLREIVTGKVPAEK